VHSELYLQKCSSFSSTATFRSTSLDHPDSEIKPKNISEGVIYYKLLLQHETTFKKQVLNVSANDRWAFAMQFLKILETNPMIKYGNTPKFSLEPDKAKISHKL
jgi:hypothetical protein